MPCVETDLRSVKTTRTSHGWISNILTLGWDFSSTACNECLESLRKNFKYGQFLETSKSVLSNSEDKWES